MQVLHSRLFGEHPQLSADLVAVLSKSEPALVAAAAAAGETKLEGGSRFAPVTVDDDGIATIRADGVISKGASAFEKSCYGGVGPQDITASLGVAMDDNRVRGIVLAMTSPGGTVGGVPEAAEYISQIQEANDKPVFAFADDLCCSAAYWMASGAGAIYTTRVGNIGSIGVYMPWMDQTARAAFEGVRVQMIKDGKFKGEGYPGTPLTREQEDLLQARVNAIGKMFRDHVSAHRPSIAREDMEGQSYMGSDAVDLGFADDVADSVAAVKADLKSYLR